MSKCVVITPLEIREADKRAGYNPEDTHSGYNRVLRRGWEFGYVANSMSELKLLVEYIPHTSRFFLGEKPIGLELNSVGAIKTLWDTLAKEYDNEETNLPGT